MSGYMFDGGILRHDTNCNQENQTGPLVQQKQLYICSEWKPLMDDVAADCQHLIFYEYGGGGVAVVTTCCLPLNLVEKEMLKVFAYWRFYIFALDLLVRRSLL